MIIIIITTTVIVIIVTILKAIILENLINSFQTNVPFLYPLKTLENHGFSNVFKWYRKGK